MFVLAVIALLVLAASLLFIFWSACGVKWPAHPDLLLTLGLIGLIAALAVPLIRWMIDNWPK